MNLPGSSTLLQRNYIFSLNLSRFGSADNFKYTNWSEILYRLNISGSFSSTNPVSYFGA